MPDAGHHIDAVRDLAVAAGAAILTVYHGAGTTAVTLKEDRSPLTAADLASHRLIVEALGRLTPQWPVLSEESAQIDAALRRDWTRFWLVDPLDGTKEFLSRNGEFTVNIALIEAGRPVLGVVHAPVLASTYSGIIGRGAWRDGAVIRCAGRPAAPPRVVASRSHRGEREDAFLGRLGEHRVVAMGSSLKLCLIAAGEADVYPRFGPTMEWDTAAGQAVIEAAGGWVTDLDGRPLAYNKPDLHNPSFVAGGGAAFDHWARCLRAEGR